MDSFVCLVALTQSINELLEELPLRRGSVNGSHGIIADLSVLVNSLTE